MKTNDEPSVFPRTGVSTFQPAKCVAPSPLGGEGTEEVTQ